MNGIFGETGTSALLFPILPTTFEASAKEFHVKLTGILRGGAMVVDEMIIKDLFVQLAIPFKRDGPFDFELSVDLAKSAWSKRANEGAR
jgi:hypothetical protein